MNDLKIFIFVQERYRYRYLFPKCGKLNSYRYRNFIKLKTVVHLF